MFTTYQFSIAKKSFPVHNYTEEKEKIKIKWIFFFFLLTFVEGAGNPFQSIDKTSVLQETRMFNETPVNARKCTHILTKILYLINQVSCFHCLSGISSIFLLLLVLFCFTGGSFGYP